MRKLYVLLFILFVSFAANAQVDVTSSGGTSNASYATLKEAFDAINAGTHTGTISIAISGNTAETATAALNASGAGSTSYSSIAISPSGGSARIISGAILAGSPLIDLNGADNVTIDGLNTGGNSLTISNTTVSATSGTSTIRLQADATNNIITNCSVLGSATMAVGTNGGNIWFGSGAVTTGNDNNTVSSCDLGPAGSNLPTKAIYSNGTSTALANSGNTVTGCNIYDYFGAAVTSAGVYVTTGNTDWTISNNKFYQTATRTQTTGAQHSAIWITNTSSNNHQIIGNTIGFANSSGTGTYNFVAFSSSSVLIPIFLNVGTTTATSVQGNTIAGIAMSGAGSGTSSSAAFRCIYVSSGLAHIGATSAGASGTGNTIGSMSSVGSITFSSSSTSAGDVIGIFNFGSSAWTVMNNNLGGITASNSSTGAANIYGIRANTSSTVSFVCENNTIGGNVANSINSTSSAAGTVLKGIISESPASTITGNTIRNFVAAGGTGTGASASIIGISSTASSANHTIVQNVIHSLSNSNASAAVSVIGINFTSTTGANLIARNNIHSFNIVSTSTTASINGISNTGGTATYQNNMIRLGIDAAGASVTNGIVINGINETAGTNNFYFNSVYVGGTGVTGSANTFAFQSTVTTNVRNYVNNIFVNARSNSSGTGKHYAVRVGGTAPNPAGLTINYNIYYAPGTGGVLGLFNGIDQAGLGGWQSAVGQDIASWNSDPQYLNPTGNATTVDLHINPSAPTKVEGKATNIPAITDDFDGEARASLTPEDIGADAGNFTAQSDIDGPVISYTALGAICSTGDRTLSATILDETGVPTAGSLVPRIYYRRNNGSWASQPGTLSSGSATNGTWDFTIVAADMPGLTNADVVSYYIIAQDVVGTPNISSNPVGVVATDVNTITTPPSTPRSYAIGILSGTYTVGSGQNFGTLTLAVSAYNIGCVNGPVVFNLTDATYPSESFPIAINNIASSSSTNTLTIKPATATAVLLSGNSGTTPTPLLRLNGADYIIIDGVNTGGASLTIENTSTAAGAAVIWLSSNGPADGATNNIVRNTNIKGGVSQNTASTVTYGIVMAGGTLANTTGSTSAGEDNDNNTIENNTFTKVRYGFYSRGGATTNLNAGTVITGNTFGATAFGPDAIGKSGVLVREEDGIQITNNTFRFIGGDFANTSGGTDKAGIAFGTDVAWSSTSAPTSVVVKNATITGNILHNIVDERTFTAAGIIISSADGTNPTNNLIANNMISGIKGNGTLGDQSVGIAISASHTDRIVFNSISLIGDVDPDASAVTPSVSAAGINLSTTAVVNPRVANNIVFMDLSSSSAPSLKNAAINIPVSFAWGTGSSDYNDFAINTSNTQSNVGSIGSTAGTFYSTLDSWRTASSQDVNSVSIVPVFTAATDLHLVPAGNPALDNQGTPVAGITVDIDGDTRNATTPDIGADEFTAPSVTDITATAVVTPTPFCPGSQQVSVTLQNLGNTTITSVTINWSITPGGAQPPVNPSLNLAPGDFVTVPLGNFSFAAGATYSITATASNPNGSADANNTNDAVTRNNITTDLIGTYTVGTGGNYSTLTAAVADYNSRLLCGPVVFQLIDATYSGETLPITINSNLNASAVNTLTIVPASGVSPTISGSSSSAVIKLNGADYIIIDGSNNGSNSRDLSIINSSTSTSTAVVWISSVGAGAGATNNVVKNINISSGLDQSTSSSSTGSFGIILSGSSISTTSDGVDNNNNVIQNNAFTSLTFGLYLRGGASSANSGNMISQNLVGPAAFGATQIGKAGIIIQHQNNATITDNEVRFVGKIIGQTSNSTDKVGIGLGDDDWTPTSTTVTNSTITGNKVHDIVEEFTFSAVGIIVAGSGTPTANTIANNMVSNVRANGTSGDQAVGIGISSGNGDRVVFNSINITGDMDPSTSTTAGVSATGVRISSTTPSNLTFANNIISVDASSNTASLRHYAIVAPSTTYAWGTGYSNYNDYYTNASNAQMALGGIGTSVPYTVVADLPSWRTQFTPNQDANSVSVQPVFVSSADLHLLVGSNAGLDNLGIPIAGITLDIDKQTRSVTNPDMGADEFANGALPAQLLTFSGQRVGNTNQLKWTVGQEFDVKDYEVERSENGRTWSKVGSVASLGNTTAQRSYGFTDNNISGLKQLYRLRQVDRNGSQKLSNIVIITGVKTTTLVLNGLFPNPASTQVSLLVDAPAKENVTITVMDALGRVVKAQKASVEAGSNTLPINVAGLSQGSYMVKIKSDNNIETSVGRFIKE